MGEDESVPGIRPERLSHTRDYPQAGDWLLQAIEAGLSPATIAAYSRAVEGFLAYCRQRRIAPRTATGAHIAAYLDELASHGLRGATLRQRLTALRLFYAYVVERGERPDNPALLAGGIPLRAPADLTPPAEGMLPWVPDEDEWARVLAAASADRTRTRLMLALAYSAALSREALCALRVGDLDPTGGTVRVPVAGGAWRTFPLAPIVADRCAAYLRERGGGDGALFLSESRRNRAAPITIWTWSKVVLALARRAGVAGFTTHTPRHLRLTDLARAGLGAGAIARFAGGRGPGAARRYLRLAAESPATPGDEIERRRADQFARVLFRDSA